VIGTVLPQSRKPGKCVNGSLRVLWIAAWSSRRPVGIGVSGGTSVGISYAGSLLYSRMFIQVQAAGLIGSGIYGGVGISAQGGGGSVGYGISSTDTRHAEVSSGIGLGGSAGVDYAQGGQFSGGGGYYGKLPLSRVRVGVGLTAGGGAMLSGLNPQAYFTRVLTGIADHPVNRIDERLPWNVAATINQEEQKLAA
jgi:IS66 C-terminal element